MKKIKLLIVLMLLFAFGSVNLIEVHAQTDSGSTYSQQIQDDQTKENIPLSDVSGFTNVVIFIRFSDETEYVAPHDFSYYYNLYNGADMASLREFYQEASYNQLDIESVFGTPDDSAIVYYTDSHPRAYYEPYDAVSNPTGYQEDAITREHVLLKNAIDYVDANGWISDSVNLDVNDDGQIDSMSFLISGNATDWNDLLWPHKFALTTYFYGAGNFLEGAPSINGKYAYNYTFEMLGNTADYPYAVSVGILAHETFHLIGAPDLYHYYRYDWIDPIGNWGLMDRVNRVPNQMLGYMKYEYGNWIDSIPEITHSGSYTLYPMQDSPNNIYRIDTGYSEEYIYLEYRDNVGVFESGLPESGLLVYRVDDNFAGMGNVNGYYSTTGHASDEVFIFRPGIDNTYPVSFPETDNPLVDEDGNINAAALSNNNPYDEMGVNTDIPMFYSNGNQMFYKIYNVVEHDGYITFDVYMPPKIKLHTDIDMTDYPNYSLVDMPGLAYYFDVDNVADGATVYYTLDGTTPTTSSNVYDGDPVQITSITNNVRIAVYLDGELMSTDQKTFAFTDKLETGHNPYGQYFTKYWYIGVPENTDYSIYFDSLTETQEGHDYITLNDGTQINQYSGDELQNTVISYSNQGLLLGFSSDFSGDDYYGFKAYVLIGTDIYFALNGDQELDVDAEADYQDAGYVLAGNGIDGYTVEENGEVNTLVPGTYIIDYLLYDDDMNLVKTIERTVNVIDVTPPEVTLKPGIDTVGDFADFSDAGVNVTDISDTQVTVTYMTDPDNDSVRIYTYTVVDDYDNQTVIKRYVTEYEQAPAVSFELGDALTTIAKGAQYTDGTCKVNINEEQFDCAIKENNVNPEAAGTYTVTYAYTYNSVEYTYKRYVFVIDTETQLSKLSLPIKREESEII